MSEPASGSSRPNKRPRYQHQQHNDPRQRRNVASTSNTKLPAILDVERFAMARAAEISGMERAMKASRESGAQRAFQSLPRHLRRRAASHHVRRLPSRLRAKAKFEMLNDQGKLLKKRKFRKLPAAKKKQLLQSSRLQTLHKRQLAKAWLETHIWHAKRMKMIDTWGYRLVSHSSLLPLEAQKAYRPSYRASAHGVLLHDASYYQTLELVGLFDSLKAVLGMVCDSSAVPASAKRYSSGIRECQTALYYCDAFPHGLIGPCTIIWAAYTGSSAGSAKKEDEEEEADVPRKLFIRFHPSIVVAAKSTIERAVKTHRRQLACTRGMSETLALAMNPDFHSNNPASIMRAILAEDQRRKAPVTLSPEQELQAVKITFRRFCTFDLTGPMATDAIRSCLKPLKSSSTIVKKAWENLPSPASVPSGMIISFDVYDPRLTFPPKLAKSDKSIGKAASLQPSVDLASNGRFWDASIRGALHAPKYTKLQLDKRRAELLLPGASLSPNPKDDRIPVMLIQRTVHQESTDLVLSSSSNAMHNSNAPMCGWTLIVPSGWGTAFWHSLVYADTRVGGLLQAAQQSFEAGAPHFPDDFPGTSAYAQHVTTKAKQDEQKWARRPPAKRVNYRKLKTRSPWKPDWERVLLDSTRHANAARAAHAADLADANATPTLEDFGKPWLLAGPLLGKVLRTLREQVRAREGVLDLQAAEQAMLELLNTERQKRSQAALRSDDVNCKDLLQRAIIRVSLTPLKRGKPKYNAMIYRLDQNATTAIGAELQPTSRDDIGLVGKAQQRGKKRPLDEDGRETSAEEEEEDLDEADNITNFVGPPSDHIIGYVTTGNLSLARGHGYGIGAISLLSLLSLPSQFSREHPKLHDLVVLFRNTNSKACWAASLQVLA